MYIDNMYEYYFNELNYTGSPGIVIKIFINQVLEYTRYKAEIIINGIWWIQKVMLR